MALVLVALTVGPPEEVSVTDEVPVHPPPVTVTVYVPAARPVMVAVVPPLDQEYVYGVVPPVALAVAEPLLCVQDGLVLVTVTVGAPEEVSVTDEVPEHPPPVTVTVYVPAASPLMVAVVPPFDHEYV